MLSPLYVPRKFLYQKNRARPSTFGGGGLYTSFYSSTTQYIEPNVLSRFSFLSIGHNKFLYDLSYLRSYMYVLVRRLVRFCFLGVTYVCLCTRRTELAPPPPSKPTRENCTVVESWLFLDVQRTSFFRW